MQISWPQQEPAKLVLPRQVNPNENKGLCAYIEDCKDSTTLLEKLKAVPHLLFKFHCAISEDMDWMLANQKLLGNFEEATRTARGEMEQLLKRVRLAEGIINGVASKHTALVVSSFITYAGFRRLRIDLEKLYRELSTLSIPHHYKVAILQGNTSTLQFFLQNQADALGKVLQQSLECHSLLKHWDREAVEDTYLCNSQTDLQNKLRDGNELWKVVVAFMEERIGNGELELLLEEIKLFPFPPDLKLNEAAEALSHQAPGAEKNGILEQHSTKFKKIMESVKNKVPLYLAFQQLLSQVQNRSSGSAGSAAKEAGEQIDDKNWSALWQTLIAYIEECHASGEFESLMSELTNMDLPIPFKIFAISDEFSAAIHDSSTRSKWRNIFHNNLKFINTTKKLLLNAKITMLSSRNNEYFGSSIPAGPKSKEFIVGSPPSSSFSKMQFINGKNSRNSSDAYSTQKTPTTTTGAIPVPTKNQSRSESKPNSPTTEPLSGIPLSDNYLKDEGAS